MKATISVALIMLATQAATADVLMTVNPLGSSSLFSITPGYGISYSPNNSINRNAIIDNTKWNESGTNYGSTGYSVIGSHDETGLAPEIQLTISGLNGQPATISALVFTNTGRFPGRDGFPAYGSQLGLTAGSLTTYSHASGGTLIALGDTTGGPEVGQYEIREFLLGIEPVVGGQVSVFMSDFAGGLVTGNLAGLVVAQSPEPSSIILAAFALAFLIIFGWRRPKLAAT